MKAGISHKMCQTQSMLGFETKVNFNNGCALSRRVWKNRRKELLEIDSVCYLEDSYGPKGRANRLA